MIVNSRQVFAETLERMLQTQSFARITVGEIADAYSSSRAIFHRYFKDKHDLVTWIFLSSFSEVVKRHGCDLHQYDAKRDWGTICECIFVTILEKPQFYQKVVEYEGQNSFTNFLLKMNAEGFQAWLRAYLGNQAALNDTAYLDSVFYYAGFAHMVKQWIEGGMKESPAFMKSMCEKNIPSSMMIYLKSDQ